MTDDSNNLVEQILRDFSELQLEVLAVHVELHRYMVKKLSQRLNCDISDIPKLKFMHAAKLTFAGMPDHVVLPLLQKLDSVRNCLAHENDPMKFGERMAILEKEAHGPNYRAEPQSHEESIRQSHSALQFVKQVAFYS